MTCARCTTRSTLLLEGNCGGQFEDGSQKESLTQSVMVENKTVDISTNNTCYPHNEKSYAISMYDACRECVTLLITVE